MTDHASESRRAECAAFERLSLADPRRAVEEADALLARMRTADDPANFAYASRTLVNALPHLGRAKDAITRAADARRFARERAPVEAARILIAVMHPRAKAGNMKGALRAGEQAVRECTALGEHELVARAELNLANVAKALGRPRRAIELIHRVLAQGDRIAAIRGQALNVLGEACVQAADLEGARRAFEEALAVCAAQGFDLGCAVVAGNLADTAARAGDIEGALRGFREARERYESLGANAEACRNTIEVATLLEFAGMLGDALDATDDAVRMADAHSLAAERAGARLVSGRVHLALGDLGAAWRDLEDAAARFEALGDGTSRAQALAARARCEAATGVPQAGATATEAVAAARANAAPVELALALAARAAIADDEHAAAESLAVAQATGIPAVRGEAGAAAAAVARRRGDTATALARARGAFGEVERTRATLALARTRRAYLSRRSEIAAELVAALLADGSPAARDEAFDVLDRARGLALLDAMERGVDRPGRRSDRDDDRDAERHARIDARARELRARIDPHANDGTLLADAARADRAAERESLERQLSRGTPGATAPRHPATLAGGPTRTLAVPAIAFFEHESRVVALVRRPNGSTDHVVLAADRRMLDEAAAAYRFQIGRRLRTADATGAMRMLAAGRAAEDALAALVFAPLADELAAAACGARIVALPSPTIAKLPLVALAPEALEIAVAPSLEVSALLDLAGASAASDEALVVSAGDARTPGITREGRAVARALQATRATTHLGEGAATLGRVRTALTRSPAIAHLSCHGIFPRSAPSLAGLRFADGWFTARDAHALEGAPRTLVLSGCATGAAANQDGEEWFGLVRGFAAAGTHEVVASLWPVEDAGAERFMERFYREYPGESPLPGRLRVVVRELREAGEHPAIASAFVAFAGAGPDRAQRGRIPGCMT